MYLLMVCRGAPALAPGCVALCSTPQPFKASPSLVKTFVTKFAAD